MKTKTNSIKTIAASLMLCGTAFSAHGATAPIAVVAGATYTVTVGNPTGLPPTDAGANRIPSSLITAFTNGSKSATADLTPAPRSTQLTIPFSFDASVFSSCSGTFLTLIQDSNGNVIRQEVAPCPSTTSSGANQIVVTPQTTKAAKVQENGMAAGGTTSIDPVSAVFMTLFSRANLSDVELAGLGSVLNTALNQVGSATNTGSGFFDYLTTVRGLTAAQMAAFKANVQNKMNASPITSATSCVTAPTTVDPTTQQTLSYVDFSFQAGLCDLGSDGYMKNMGLAASSLLHILTDSANDPALPPQPTDFPRDWILEALYSMGNVAQPLMAAAAANYNGAGGATNAAAPAISPSGLASIQKTIDQAMKKLKGDRAIANFTDAMTILGGSAADTQQFTNAANAFNAAMDAAYAAFEKAGNTCVAVSPGCPSVGAPINPDDPNSPYNNDPANSNYVPGADPEADQQAAYAAAQVALTGDPTATPGSNANIGAIGVAYNAFFNAMQASNARIAAMIKKMNCTVSATVPYCPQATDFQQPGITPGTYVNWPITKVVLTDWVYSTMAANGGITYRRDTTPIPAAMSWMGTCMVGGVPNPNAQDAVSCAAGTPAMTFPDPNDPTGVATITLPAVAPGTWTQARTDFTSASSWASYLPVSVQSMMGITEDISIQTFIRDQAVGMATTDAGFMQAEKNLADALYGTTPANGLSGAIGGTVDGTTAITPIQADAIVQLSQDPNF